MPVAAVLGIVSGVVELAGAIVARVPLPDPELRRERARHRMEMRRMREEHRHAEEMARTTSGS